MGSLDRVVRMFRHAWVGVAETFREEQSFRLQSLAAAIVVFAVLVLPLPATAAALVLFVSATVLALELMNSSIERLADATAEEAHPKIRAAKDAASGAVLLVAAGAVLVAFVLLTGGSP